MPWVDKFSLMGTMFHGQKHSIPEKYETCSVEFIADQLCNQKSVAVFNGLAEAGPRALGNRSILFDCTNKDAKEELKGIAKKGVLEIGKQAGTTSPVSQFAIGAAVATGVAIANSKGTNDNKNKSNSRVITNNNFDSKTYFTAE